MMFSYVQFQNRVITILFKFVNMHEIKLKLYMSLQLLRKPYISMLYETHCKLRKLYNHGGTLIICKTKMGRDQVSLVGKSPIFPENMDVEYNTSILVNQCWTTRHCLQGISHLMIFIKYGLVRIFSSKLIILMLYKK